MTVPPGRCGLKVGASNPEFIPQQVSSGELRNGVPGGWREYPDGFVLLDLKAEQKELPVTVKVRRGVTLQGRVLGPEGQAVAYGAVMKECYLGDSWHYGSATSFPIQGGQFALPGMDPEKPETIYFADPEDQWGAMLELDPKVAQPVTVQTAGVRGGDGAVHVCQRQTGPEQGPEGPGCAAVAEDGCGAGV